MHSIGKLSDCGEYINRRGATLITSHWISSKENLVADFLTRHNTETWELKLSNDVFTQILTHYKVMPTLDAFASRATAQIERYMSWKEDTHAIGPDALLCKWDKMSYLFPPVPLIPKTLNKVVDKQITAILICPMWPSSLWWLRVKSLLLAPPLPLPSYKEILTSIQGELKVYLEPLVALLISGRV